MCQAIFFSFFFFFKFLQFLIQSLSVLSLFLPRPCHVSSLQVYENISSTMTSCANHHLISHQKKKKKNHQLITILKFFIFLMTNSLFGIKKYVSLIGFG